MFRTFCFFILFSFTALPAFALEPYEWSIDLNTGSRHIENNSQYKFNEDNKGAGISYGYNDYLDIKLGFFENSYYKTSFYFGGVLNKDFYFLNDFVISPGIGLILATGYQETPMDAPMIAPIVHPSITFGHKNLRSTIGYIPYDNAKVITFQTQFLF